MLVKNLEMTTRLPVFRIVKSGATTPAERVLIMLPGDITIYTWNGH
jgi:pyridoxal biosynthesis lyase PdxS